MFQLTEHLRIFLEMGGSVSAGSNNDELIDHLVEAEFIKTPRIQYAFRAVDRGNYYTQNQKQNAYKDISWRTGNLHLSAPCVYSVVMEALKVKPGNSFLNLGSGTGYFNTVAGLQLGPYGVNHGIELHSDVVDFAYERLEEFMKNSHAIDEYDFCEPVFTVGNCLTLDSNCQQYDRVYCGASCPAEYELYVRNLIKIGGILIMPLNEKLLKITRTEENKWHTSKVLSVSFTPLVPPPTTAEVLHAKLSDVCPPKLQHICRSKIRNHLRKNVEGEHPTLKTKQELKEQPQHRQVRRIVIPFLNDSDMSSDSEVDYDSDLEFFPEYMISSRLPSRMTTILEEILRRHSEMHPPELVWSDSDDHSDSSSDSESQPPQPPRLLVSSGQPPQPSRLRASRHSPASPQNDGRDTGPPSSEQSDRDRAEQSEDGGLVSLIALSHLRQQRPQEPQSSEESSSSFMLPPSQSTRSKVKQLQMRKRPASNEKEAGPSGSQAGPAPRKRARRGATVVWQKLIHNPKQRRDTEKKETEEENYTQFMIEKIGALPLPSILLRYLNYKRDNL